MVVPVYFIIVYSVSVPAPDTVLTFVLLFDLVLGQEFDSPQAGSLTLLARVEDRTQSHQVVQECTLSHISVANNDKLELASQVFNELTLNESGTPLLGPVHVAEACTPS